MSAPTNQKLVFLPSDSSLGVPLKVSTTSTAIPSTIICNVKGYGKTSNIQKSAQLTLEVNQTAEPDPYIVRLQPQLKITGPIMVPPNTTFTFQGSLTEPDRTAIGAARIAITSNFGLSTEISTDSRGAFSWDTQAPATIGTYAITANYAGDMSHMPPYKNATATYSFQVFGYVIPPLPDLVAMFMAAIQQAVGSWAGVAITIILAIIIIVIITALIWGFRKALSAGKNKGFAGYSSYSILKREDY